jgi:hypothetical protein
MAFDQPIPSAVTVDKVDGGYEYVVTFRGKRTKPTGPFKTSSEAMAAGNRDLARLEASDKR